MYGASLGVAEAYRLFPDPDFTVHHAWFDGVALSQNLYQPKGFFTPPYETEQSLRARLSGLYEDAEVMMVEGIGCFCCRK